MRVLFLSYWGINEGLTAATVFPHLKILAGFDNIELVHLVTIERKPEFDLRVLPKDHKIIHTPLSNRLSLPNLLVKVLDFIVFPKELEKICRKNKIDLIIARGAPAGALAMKVSIRTNIPYTVESFEPHADYMLESGTWNWFDPRYIFQKKWERQQITTAKGLMPVADNYRKLLIAQGVEPAKIDVIPCCVPLEEFKFNPESRIKIRKSLNADDLITGIYTGKFGGIYYMEEAFNIFKMADDFFTQKLFLIILSPDDPNWIKKALKENGLDLNRVLISSVPHHEMPAYLSAADFGFSLQKPKPSNLYLSPIKNAEYWAAGLPIIMSSGVGDDSEILENEKAGALFRDYFYQDDFSACFKTISRLVSEEGIRERLHKVAAKYRHFGIVEAVYKKWYS